MVLGRINKFSKIEDSLLGRLPWTETILIRRNNIIIIKILEHTSVNIFSMIFAKIDVCVIGLKI